MEINQNPLELLTAKVRETVADTQNLANEIAAKVEESTTVLTAWVQSAPSSIVSAGAIATQEAFKIAHNIRFENLPTNLQFKFARAGVRDGMRNVQEAAKVFESIPAQIRAQGQKQFATSIKIKIGVTSKRTSMEAEAKLLTGFLNIFG